jgi:hypothetical protein
VLQFLFAPERAARLIEQHARTAGNPGLEEVLDAILAATWKAPPGRGIAGEIGRVVDQVVLYDLIALSRDTTASAQTRAVASLTLQGLRQWAIAAATRTGDLAERAHLAYAAQQIAELDKEPRRIDAQPAPPPDGPPIGAAGLPGDRDDDEP